MPTKESLRREIKLKLEVQSHGERRKRSRMIEERLFGLEAFQKAATVCFYVSTPTEVDTTSMIDRALGMGKQVLAPVCDPQKKELKLYEIKSRREDLKKGAFGIMEPDPERARPASLKEVDAIIVPGVVFDQKKNRIGHGKGFYDRFLGQFDPEVPKIGLAFSFQVVGEIPGDGHDVKVDILLTDEGAHGS